jgi:hypothetical protein
MKINKITKSTNQISKIVRGLKTILRNGVLEDFSMANLKSFIEDALSFIAAKCNPYGLHYKHIMVFIFKSGSFLFNNPFICGGKTYRI